MIRILPRSQACVVGIECSGIISLEDYTNTLIPAFTKALSEHGKIRLLLEFNDNFAGYSFKAKFADVKYSIKYMKNFERWVMINGPWWAQMFLKIIDKTTRCQCRSFDKSTRDKAWDYIES